MAGLLNKAEGLSMDRRAFLRGAALTAAAAMAGTGANSLVANQALADQASQQGAEWKTAPCWHNCGGRCLNQVLVKDGVVLRQRTDCLHDDTVETPQQRGCLRGRSQRRQVFADDRLKYPMKRKHWEPHTGGDKSLRGCDEWERISWDEALDYVAEEIRHNMSTYGPSSIVLESYLHGELTTWETRNVEMARPLAAYGGYVDTWSCTSWGNWVMAAAGTYGFANICESMNDRLDLTNVDTFIMLGSNPARSSMGSPTYHFERAHEAGAKFVCIDPTYTATCSVFDGEWVPVRVGTDTALLLGVAHEIIANDTADNPTIDWDFLRKYTIGFDETMMPDGADPHDNFRDYVMGTYDGTPKTPEWAERICGTPADQIRSLAGEFSLDKNVAFLASWAPACTFGSDSLPQLMMTIGCMTGHIGRPGNMTGASAHAYAANGGHLLVNIGQVGLAYNDPAIAIPNPCDDVIHDSELYTAILDGEYTYTAGGSWQPAERRNIDIHMIYNARSARLQTREAAMKGIEAYRKLDFVVSHAQFMTTNATFSDIVLPVTTPWEREGGLGTGNREIAIMYSHITEPLFESKDDLWIAQQISDRLGLDRAQVWPYDAHQDLFNMIAGCNVVPEGGHDAPDGEGYEPLVTITQDDIDAWGVQGTPQQGRITLEQFQQQGLFQVPRSEGDTYGYIAFKDFIDDPEGNPRPSESGKFEIYCRRKKEIIDSLGFSTEPADALPTWQPSIEGYMDTFSDWDAQEKGEYPLQAFSPHYLRRSHTTFDNVPQLREAWPNYVLINTKDAEENGIGDGDAVKITSPYGCTLRNAEVTQTIMPGVIALPHGSWIDIDPQTGIDTGGADEMLTAPRTWGQGTSGWNSVICRIEKYDHDLTPDVDKPLRFPNADESFGEDADGTLASSGADGKNAASDARDGR